MIQSTKIDKYDAFFIFAEFGKITKNELLTINKYIDRYNEKIIGWFLIDKDSNLN